MEQSTEEGVWRLRNAAVIGINGEDAPSFLHGQLTQAVTTLDEARARPAAYCTAQGRVLANGVLWRLPGGRDLRWMVSRDLVQSLTARLRLFVLRQKVSIEPLGDEVVLGARGARAVPAPLRDESPWTYAILEGDHWIVAPMSTPERPAAWRITGEAAELPGHAGSSGWDAIRLASGWPWVAAASTEKFLPGALDMDLNGTIDFRKGCYPGQEIIARSHYRGTVKRRLAYGKTIHTSRTGVDTGLEDLYLEGNGERPAGRVIESVVHEGSLHVAAEIMLPVPVGARYTVGSPAGPSLELSLVHEGGLAAS